MVKNAKSQKKPIFINIITKNDISINFIMVEGIIGNRIDTVGYVKKINQEEQQKHQQSQLSNMKGMLVALMIS